MLIINNLQKQIIDKEITITEIVTKYLKNINKKQKLNAFVEVFEEEALKKAKKIQEKIDNNKTVGKLFGVVIGIKDNILYKGHKVSAASKILDNYEAIYNSTVVKRLLDEDAIIIGRLNCDEFAMGGSNEHSNHGKVLNPIDETKVPGGSSGGSAVAVAANLCHIALGSDTGGSVRQPASYCGIVGMKPTYGRISRWGLIAYGSSFDQIGVLSRSVEDAALILQIIAGKDEYDSTSVDIKVDNYAENLDDFELENKKIAYFDTILNYKELDKEIKQDFYSKIELFKNNGAIVKSQSTKLLDFVLPTYYILTTAEASSNLSRYDGIHYGYRSKTAKNIEQTYTNSRSEGFGWEVKRRIMTGTFVLSAGYYDAYYAKAQKVRRLIYDEIQKIFKENDFIIMPTTIGTAFDFGEQDPIKMYLQDIFTVWANLSGVPAISVPISKHSNSLPYGFQIMTNHFKEKEMFKFAKKVSQLY